MRRSPLESILNVAHRERTALAVRGGRVRRLRLRCFHRLRPCWTAFLSILLCIVWSVTGRALPAPLAILALAVAIDQWLLVRALCYTPVIFDHQPHVICHMIMSVSHPRDPVHGVRLVALITELVEQYGWGQGRRDAPRSWPCVRRVCGLTSSPARGTGCTIIRPDRPHASSITERPAS